MNCCDDYGNCRQGRDCPIRTKPYVYSLFIRFLVAVGAVAVIMFILGYTYASLPLEPRKTCIPTIYDWILK
jgi:hypothetical protein